MAARLGLVPAGSPAFLRLNADGTVTVLGAPAKVPTPPVPLTPAQKAAAKAAAIAKAAKDKAAKDKAAKDKAAKDKAAEIHHRLRPEIPDRHGQGAGQRGEDDRRPERPRPNDGHPRKRQPQTHDERPQTTAPKAATTKHPRFRP